MSQANRATTTTDTGTLRREIFIEAAQATVFSFFTDPDKMARWMGTSHRLDPKPGGIYLVEVNATHTARAPSRRSRPTRGWSIPSAGTVRMRRSRPARPWWRSIWSRRTTARWCA